MLVWTELLISALRTSQYSTRD